MASDLIDEPVDEAGEPSSPACNAHRADDAYMGYASPAEIAAFLTALDTADAGTIRKMLPRIRDDALHREVAARLQAYEGSAAR